MFPSNWKKMQNDRRLPWLMLCRNVNIKDHQSFVPMNTTYPVVGYSRKSCFKLQSYSRHMSVRQSPRHPDRTTQVRTIFSHCMHLRQNLNPIQRRGTSLLWRLRPIIIETNQVLKVNRLWCEDKLTRWASKSLTETNINVWQRQIKWMIEIKS